MLAYTMPCPKGGQIRRVHCTVISLPRIVFSSARFSLSFAICMASSPSASASFAFLGATTLATRSYTSIARTHLQRPSHAVEADLMTSG